MYLFKKGESISVGIAAFILASWHRHIIILTEKNKTKQGNMFKSHPAVRKSDVIDSAAAAIRVEIKKKIPGL